MTSLAFDQAGSHLYSGDAAGCVHTSKLQVSHARSCNNSKLNSIESALVRSQQCAQLRQQHDHNSTDMYQEDPQQKQQHGIDVDAQLVSSCKAFKGDHIAAVCMVPPGHWLLVLTRSNRLCALDLRTDKVARQYDGVRSHEQSLMPAVSPDGSFIICGMIIQCAFMISTVITAVCRLTQWQLRYE